MKKLAWSCVVAAFLAGSSPFSRAQDMSVLEGAYVGIGAGATRARFVKDDFDATAAGATVSADDTDKGYKVTLGWKLDRYWALELGRTNFGKFSHTYDGGAAGSVVQSYKVSGWWGGVLAILPIGNHFSLFGRLGQFKSDTSTETVTASGTLVDTLRVSGVPVDSGAKSKKSTILGVGAQIDFPGHIGLRIEAEDYGEAGDQDNTGRARMRMATVSLMYRF